MIKQLQAPQNSALYVATDFVKMTSIDHLPETKVLPVQCYDNLSLLGSQCLARTLQPNNPCKSEVRLARSAWGIVVDEGFAPYPYPPSGSVGAHQRMS